MKWDRPTVLNLIGILGTLNKRVPFSMLMFDIIIFKKFTVLTIVRFTFKFFCCEAFLNIEVMKRNAI